MKGVIKGFNKFISKKFVTTEKEPEIQIGNPTDVKHVAHIGSDGPSQNPPTWMNDFKGSAIGDAIKGEGSQSIGMGSGSIVRERAKSRKPSRKSQRDSSKAIQISDTGQEQSFRHKSSREGSRKTRKKKSKDINIINEGSGKSRSSRSTMTQDSSRESSAFSELGSESESKYKLSNDKYVTRNFQETVL